MGNIVFVAFKGRHGKHRLTESLIVTKEMDVRDLYDIVEETRKGSVSAIYTIRRKRKLELSGVPEEEDDDNDDDDEEVRKLQEHSPTVLAITSDYGDAAHDKVLYALKEIDLAKLDAHAPFESVRNEIDMLRRLDHPSIIRAFETYNYISNDDGKSLMTGIVLEHCNGGDLYSRAPYTEQQAGKILYKLVEAVSYLHQHKIIHRDIKLENILFESDDPEAGIKLIDFGLSTKFGRNENFEQTVGTVYTMAPQVFMGHYDVQADMWSIGVVAFVLLSGEKPFWAERWSTLREKIIAAEYSFDSPAWKSVSDDAKRFVVKLLEYDPFLRFTSEQALKNKWLAKFKPNVNQSTVKHVLSQFNQVSYMSEMEQLAWLVVARKCRGKELVPLRQVFEELDQNHDGMIHHTEFKTAMMKILGIRSKEVETIFRLVDVQRTGAVDYTTFLAALLAVQGRLYGERVTEVFDHLDVDHCGYITHDHLRQILGHKVSKRFMIKLLGEIETHDYGRIGLEEFKQALGQKVK